MFDFINGIYLKFDEESEAVILPKECKEIAPFAFKNSCVKKVVCNEGLTKICSNVFLVQKSKKLNSLR